MKLINDTLKGPNGKWSRKSLTAFVSFFVSIVLGTYIVLAEVVNIYAISVFSGFLILAGSTLGMSVVDKLNQRNENQPK